MNATTRTPSLRDEKNPPPSRPFWPASEIECVAAGCLTASELTVKLAHLPRNVARGITFGATAVRGGAL